jgi:hypothetical protein
MARSLALRDPAFFASNILSSIPAMADHALAVKCEIGDAEDVQKALVSGIDWAGRRYHRSPYKYIADATKT